MNTQLEISSKIVIALLLILPLAGFPIYGQVPTGLSTFKDPQGKFYLQFPSDWTAQGKENRFSSSDLKITFNEGMAKTTSYPIFVIITTHNYSNPLLNMKIVVDQIIEVIQGTYEFPEFSLFQTPEFTKYNIDGHSTGSFIYTWNIPSRDLDVATLSLATKSELGNLLRIEYTASQDDFDKYLPSVEKIISSIKMNETIW